MTAHAYAKPWPLGRFAGQTTFGVGLRGKVLIAAAALLVMAWGAVGTVLHMKWQDAVEAELRQNTNVARVLEEQTVRVFATADQATRRMRDAVAAQGGALSPVDMVRFANETGLAPAILVQLSQIDAEGRFVGSNLDPNGERTGHVDLSGREHVRVHLKPQTLPEADRLADPDALFIGKPVLGKVSRKWTIQLSRRMVDASGALQGVVVASLDPSYFEEVYRHVQLGRQGNLSLVGSDLVFRARVVGGQSVGMGTTLPPGSLFAAHVKADEGQFQGRGSTDGVQRIGAYRRITGYPVYLLVMTARDDALASWDALRNISLVLTALLTTAVALGAAYFVLSLHRIEDDNSALRRSEAQANAANQAKSEFLAAISHELRTPLTSIRGFAELMEHRLEQPRFREQAGLIRKGAEHLNELLTQILDLAKVEAGAMPLTSEPVDLRAMVQGTADFFSLAASAKGLALNVDIAADVPAQFNGDSLRLKQILNNLMSNALKFTEAGSVTLAAGRRGDALVFEVADTGPGIPAELHETIFEKFRQADARVSYQHGGTGLGLALSQGLARLMNGSITLVSAPGEGSRFTLQLPLGPR